MRFVRAAAGGLLGLIALSTAFAFDSLQPGDRANEAVVARVNEVMHRLGVALNKKDLAGFHDSPAMSKAFAQQISAEQLGAAFRPLLDNHVDLTKLDGMAPQLDGIAQVDTANQLVVKGHYASEPPTAFEMRFIREGNKLGLSFLDVHLIGGKPDASNLRALLADSGNSTGYVLPPDQMAAVREAMHAFAVAVNHRDMSRFLAADIVSQFWRERQTAAQLDADYRNTIASRGDFTLLDGLVPIIPEAPGTDARGVLDISGYYAAPDSRIGFKMGFVNEDNRWRLLNFSIAPLRALAPTK